MVEAYVTPFDTYQRAPQKAVVFGAWGNLHVEFYITSRYPDGSMDVVTASVYGEGNDQKNAARVTPGSEIWKWRWQ